jgi:hypothetical protein
MDIELVKASLTRLRERRAAIPAMRDYKPQKSGGAKKANAPEQVALNLDTLIGRLNTLSSKPAMDEKKGGE